MPQDKRPSILGVGNDIIEIDRIRDSIKAHGRRFLDRIFTPKEQEYCLNHQDSAPRFAGRFAAKEAIAKALGTGFGEQLSWLDIEILANGEGRPMATLSERLNAKFHHPTISLSISHCKSYVTAVAIWS
ncbi:MAG TPA: holo-ACP synthase [Rhabdochlamydiaceae bacterium]|nr:holo-ACP synthase [Rhabdochlamydiaceae bacterium]